MPKASFITNMIRNSGGGFDKLTRNVKILTASDGNCTATVKVEDKHTNILGGLHGGYAATLVDNISGFSLVTHKYGERPSVSVNINMEYLQGAKQGDELLIESKAVKVGKTLAFMEVQIFNNENKKLLIKASHVKCFLKDFKL